MWHRDGRRPRDRSHRRAGRAAPGHRGCAHRVRRRLPLAGPVGTGGSRRRVEARPIGYRQRIVHHMVLGELVRDRSWSSSRTGGEVRRSARRAGQLRAGCPSLRGGCVRPRVDGPGAQRIRRARAERRRRERDGPAPGLADRARRRRPRPRSPVAGVLRAAARHARLPGVGHVRQPRVRSPARPAAPIRRLRSTTSCTCSPTTAPTCAAKWRCSRSSAAPIPIPKGFGVARDADRPLRDGLHHELRLLRPRRARSGDPGAGHARPCRRRHPSRQGDLAALQQGPVRPRLPRARDAARRRGPRDHRGAAEVGGCTRLGVGRAGLVRGHVGDATQARRGAQGGVG